MNLLERILAISTCKSMKPNLMLKKKDGRKIRETDQKKTPIGRI